MTTEELSNHARAAGISVSVLGLVREADVPRLLGVTLRTLHNWKKKRAPACTRIGGRNWYSLEALARFVSEER